MYKYHCTVNVWLKKLNQRIMIVSQMFLFDRENEWLTLSVINMYLYLYLYMKPVILE